MKNESEEVGEKGEMTHKDTYQKSGICTQQRQFKGKVTARIAKTLKRHGVSLIFGQSLPSALLLTTPFFGIKQAVYRTENAGGAMADGYARISNRVSVVTAQNGPSATLLVPPLSEALKASIPIVALVQGVHREQNEKNAFQEFDHLTLFRSCTKWVRQIEQPSRVEDFMDMAFVNAASGRPGPVALILPPDLLISNSEGEALRTQSMGKFPIDRTIPEPDLIDEAAKLLAEAERPVIIAGGGVHISGACEEYQVLSFLDFSSMNRWNQRCVEVLLGRIAE